MKQKLYILLTGFFAFLAQTPSFAQCPNGNLENGNLTNWQGRNRINNNGTVNLNLLLAGGPANMAIMSPGPDPIVGALNRVRQGNFSLRLGNSQVGANLDMAWYTFTVSAANPRFSFQYALVMQDPPDHAPAQRPFFGYGMCLGNTPSDLPANAILAPGASLHMTSDRNSNPFIVFNPAIVYMPWTPRCIDLSAYIGQVVTIYFYTADCSATGHFGYAYIDGLCENNDANASFTMPSAVCISDPITVNGSASTNEVSHLWTIEESDQWWGRPNPSSEVIEYYTGQEAGSVDLHQIMAKHGRKFKCNTYYRVKLAVSNQCVPWDDEVKLLYVSCPPNIDAGPDIIQCCNQTGLFPITIGPAATVGNTYSWTWFPNGASTAPSPNSQLTINQAPPVSSVYVLTASDTTGCTAYDSVFFYLLEPFRINISQVNGTACNEPTILTAVPELITDSCDLNETAWWTQRKLKLPFSYQWSNGSTSASTSVNPGAATTYSVTVQNSCYNATKSIAVSTCPAYTGPFPSSYPTFDSLLVPLSFTPNGDGINDYFDVTHLAPPPGMGPYNALEYEFKVFDRWGSKQYFQSKGSTTRCTGFINGTIPHWDGTVNTNTKKKWWQFWLPKAGSKLPQGVYLYMLYFKNCSHGNWYLVAQGDVTLIL